MNAATLPVSVPRMMLAGLPVLAGLLAMYVPSFIDVARIYWANERGTAGPLILAVSAWIGWRKLGELARIPDEAGRPRAGSLLLGLGLLSYAIGRSQQFAQLEIGSLIPVFAGIVVGLRGAAGLRAVWFPLLYLAFVVPLPGSLLDAILIPLKQQVSIVAEALMHSAGYPVARTGVVLSIGQYQLLIADACSGLSSMISLTGIGLVYVHLAGNPSRLHNAVLLLAVLPTAFVANIVRVCLLMWVTYEFGDAAGQNFHDQAGYLEIAFAFALFFGLDLVLRSLPRPRRTMPARSVPSATEVIR